MKPYEPKSPRAEGEEAAFANERGKAYTRPLIRSLQWTETEKRFGKPMREILLQAHMERGTISSIATMLGVHRQTIQCWWTHVGLPEFGANDDGTVTIVICGETDAHTQTGDPMTGVQTEAGL